MEHIMCLTIKRKPLLVNENTVAIYHEIVLQSSVIVLYHHLLQLLQKEGQEVVQSN